MKFLIVIAIAVLAVFYLKKEAEEQLELFSDFP